jgi:hypothetical protein
MKIIFIAILLVWYCINFQKRSSSSIDPIYTNSFNSIDTTESSYNTLTNLDRGKYILTVKLISIGKDVCSTPVEKSYILKAVLENKSNDTLKYIDWTCLHDIWHSNSKLIWINEQNSSCLVCDADHINIFQVPPHRSVTKQLLAEFKEGTHPMLTKFRIGMILQRVMKKNDWDYYGKYFILKKGIT